METSYTLKKDFEYRHRNPYHDKLENYAHFVMRDREAETFSGKWNKEVFQNDHPIAAEIGTGFGHFMLDYCRDHPAINFVGLDYRFKRSWQLAKRIHRMNLTNIRYLRARGERLHFIFGPKEVDDVFFFFPDPWPKKRQRKKRLFQSPLLESVHRVLKPGGKFFIKTDHDHYASWMVAHFENDPRWVVTLQTNDLWNEHLGHFLTDYVTKFEKIFLAQKVPIKAFVLQKKETGGPR
ncbi:MAG: tRNA (guanosine(46)-N7)-methyltransferase TrmB [Bacteriovoracales bacterium]|nr:tRNA (guanosine(46)-N7)-methyltransferase TrmB [Bacteriovoracales bacterium]